MEHPMNRLSKEWALLTHQMQKETAELQIGLSAFPKFN